MISGQIPNEMFSSHSDAATVLSVIRTQNTNAQLRNALFYLEAHNFNTVIAIQGFELDTIDRAGAPIQPGSMKEVSYQSENSGIDRSLALPGNSFDPSKLMLRIKTNGKLTTWDFPNTNTFDHNNIEHVKDLNWWRHEQIR